MNGREWFDGSSMHNTYKWNKKKLFYQNATTRKICFKMQLNIYVYLYSLIFPELNYKCFLYGDFASISYEWDNILLIEAQVMFGHFDWFWASIRTTLFRAFPYGNFISFTRRRGIHSCVWNTFLIQCDTLRIISHLF